MTDKPYSFIMNNIHADIIAKARKIELVVFDVDGILTDGGIYMSKREMSQKDSLLRMDMG